MAKPATTSKQPQLGLSDLFKEEQELQKQLEAIRIKKADMAREQAESIRNDVLKALQDISNQIAPLVEQDSWSWRALPDFEIVLSELELMPREPKALEMNQEMAEIVAEFVKSMVHGCTIDQISEGILDSNNKPRWKVGTLRPQVPQFVKAGLIKQRPNPANGRQNLYFIEA